MLPIHVILHSVFDDLIRALGLETPRTPRKIFTES